ncbi:MAG TPA: hypothetical protein DDW52_23445 [Planctomycetaceae bacterium]|nr:hypothetical protein [Planctomycetaceae bacterium]
MKSPLKTYWAITCIFCLAMAGGGVVNLLRFDFQRRAMAELGFPDYLMTILGVAKILGVLGLLQQSWSGPKEWAYAGFTFLLVGASASHAFNGDSILKTALPLLFLSLGIGSYLLCPRRCEGVTG